MFVSKIESNRGLIISVPTGSIYLDYKYNSADGSYTRPFNAMNPIEFWKGKFLITAGLD